MRYPAIVTREGKYDVAVFHFADGSECASQAGPGESIEAMAAEALEGRLRSYLGDRETPPHPARISARRKVLWVSVPAQLAAKIAMRWTRESLGLSQGDLARRMGVTRQQVVKWESPKSNPGLEVLDRLAHAMNATLDVRFEH